MARVLLELVDNTGCIVQIKLDVDRPVKIGRNPDNDLIFSNDFVSRRHAVIFISQSGFLVFQDLGSTYGSSLMSDYNDTKNIIKLKPNIQHQLTAGSVIMLGNSSKIRFIEVIRNYTYNLNWDKSASPY